MKNSRKYLRFSVAMIITLSASSYAMEPMGEPSTSSESGYEHPISAKDAKNLLATIQNLRDALTLLDETLIQYKNEKTPSYIAITEIVRQQKILTKAINLADRMYLGQIPVNMNLIQECMNEIMD